jgi:hypothetical protein
LFFRMKRFLIFSVLFIALSIGARDVIITGGTVTMTGGIVITNIPVAPSACNDTTGATTIGSQDWGDNNNAQVGIATKFVAGCSTTVTQITVRMSVAAGLNFITAAQIYTDNSGSPGTQIGGNSSAVNDNAIGATEQSVVYGGMSSAITSGTTYWLVLVNSGFNNSFPRQWYYATDVVGVMKSTPDGTSWVARSTGGTGKFKIN